MWPFLATVSSNWVSKGHNLPLMVAENKINMIRQQPLTIKKYLSLCSHCKHRISVWSKFYMLREGTIFIVFFLLFLIFIRRNAFKFAFILFVLFIFSFFMQKLYESMPYWSGFWKIIYVLEHAITVIVLKFV